MTLSVAIHLALLACVSGATAGEWPPAIIPKPVLCEMKPGRFQLSERTTIQTPPAFTNEAALLRGQLEAATGWKLPVKTKAGKGGRDTICLATASFGRGREAYELEVTGSRVTLSASGPAGMFRAVQTLAQLVPLETVRPGGGSSRCELPAVRIEDAPRFEWRGLMLDCSRTFQSVEYLKKTLDRMALYKLNVLHLHLTDDQGWRFELKKYPDLARKAGFFPAKYNEPPGHQGYYTQAQLRDLVAYAAARHILIVPEIEMPGHSLALLSVMPELSCTGGPFEFFPYGQGPGIIEDVLCAGREETFQFLQEVIEEVVSVFPGPFVHIGGDEVPRKRWQQCLRCQERMKTEGLKTEAELQSWFNRRIERMLAARGRRLVGWDEILEGGVSPQTVVMGWRGVAPALAAAQSGHDVVMTPNSHCYIDLTYGAIDSARAFSYDPLAGLPPAATRHVLGLQASYWSHLDREPELVDRQLFPRLLALAERAWSPDNRNQWPDYERRARVHLARLTTMGIRYEPLDFFGPVGEWTEKSLAGGRTSLEFDVTARIAAGDEHEVTLAYVKGKRAARLHAAELLRDADVVARDPHESFLAWGSPRQVYRLKAPPGGQGGRYRLRVVLDAADATNFLAKVFIAPVGAR